MARVILSRHWKNKPKAKYFAIRDKAKAETAERKWKAKSKSK